MKRLNQLRGQLLAKKEIDPKNSITITDNRYGNTINSLYNNKTQFNILNRQSISLQC